MLLPRSNVPAHLSFVLDGYEPAVADVVPNSDDSVKVKLTAHAKKHPATPVKAPGPSPRNWYRPSRSVVTV